MKPRQQLLDVHNELIVDLFAGGGGMSEGIFRALGRHPDIAINHNDDALSMHRVNHPQTRHFVADVFEVDPRGATQGRLVGHLHLSPDCTHHSQAAGGQPRNGKIRALTWVGKRWAGQVKPRTITLENVTQILKWSPLIAKRCKQTGRAVKLDGTVAEKGEVVPRDKQFLVPDKKREGKTWRAFKRQLEQLGYVVETKSIMAADLGAHTTRERLYMIARCDGVPITWPQQTHFKKPAKGQKKWNGAHECIDFSLPSKSIFEREKPLADATLRRVAKGVKKFVLDNGAPFIVPIAHFNGSEPVHDITEPMRTITAFPKGGSLALVTPVMIQAGHGEGKSDGVKRWGAGFNDIKDPLGTITASGGYSLATAFLAQYYGDKSPNGEARGQDLNEPLFTQTTENRHALVTAHICTMRKNIDSESIEEPLSTVTTSGAHHALVECHLNKSGVEDKALRVAAFLMSYYGTDCMSELDHPMPTITTKDRLALVTVIYKGEKYLIVDICLRMLQPHELYAAQGFGKDYIIDVGHDGRKFTKTTQVKLCGNSVSPIAAEALAREIHKDDDMRLVA